MVRGVAAQLITDGDKLTKLNVAKVREAIKNSQGILSVVAIKCKVSRNAIYEFLQKYPELNKDVQNEREKMHDYTEGKFFQAINRDESWAIAMYLKTLAKSRGYVERIETIDKTKEVEEQVKRFQEATKEAEDGNKEVKD